MVRDRGRIVCAIHFRYARASMLNKRQVGADVDGSFGMAAISEAWLSTCTWPNYSIPVRLWIPNIMSRVAGRYPPTHGIGVGMAGIVHPRDRGCRGTPALSAMKHVAVGRQGLWWITGSWRHQGLASRPAEPGLLYGKGRFCPGSQRRVGWPPNPYLPGFVPIPEGGADYTHPVCSSQDPGYAIGLGNGGQPGMGVPVLC